MVLAAQLKDEGGKLLALGGHCIADPKGDGIPECACGGGGRIGIYTDAAHAMAPTVAANGGCSVTGRVR